MHSGWATTAASRGHFWRFYLSQTSTSPLNLLIFVSAKEKGGKRMRKWEDKQQPTGTKQCGSVNGHRLDDIEGSTEWEVGENHPLLSGRPPICLHLCMSGKSVTPKL
ncbi:hypothetical protein TcWFU_007488 [Taenia crassiceps]|uniref:Uncharacterized protein n=1 Tax=Taenia crassiceps TaxID=6207 RepID=A0ABR4QRL3_9CEST